MFLKSILYPLVLLLLGTMMIQYSYQEREYFGKKAGWVRLAGIGLISSAVIYALKTVWNKF